MLKTDCSVKENMLVLSFSINQGNPQKMSLWMLPVGKMLKKLAVLCTSCDEIHLDADAAAGVKRAKATRRAVALPIFVIADASRTERSQSKYLADLGDNMHWHTQVIHALPRSLSLSLYIYIYIYIHIHTYIHTYIHIHGTNL